MIGLSLSLRRFRQTLAPKRVARYSLAMQQRPHGSGDQDEAARRTAALMGFIVILLLAIAGIILVRELRSNASLEDCLMSGRHNCAPIEVPVRRP